MPSVQPLSFSLLLATLLSACRLNTETLTTVEELSRDIPNIIVKNVIYKEKERQKLTQEVYAEEFQIFSQSDLVQVKKGTVKTYDAEGIAQLDGLAEFAEYNQETEDAAVQGPIEVYYYPEATRITAQQLDWKRRKRLLTSKSIVTVVQDNGTNFAGEDFSVDMATKTVSYGKNVSGELYALGEEGGGKLTGRSEDTLGVENPREEDSADGPL